MQKFIDATIKPVLIIGGLGTAAAGLYGFFPRFAVENIAELEFIRDYTIFVQHWGFMVGLIGVFMVVAAFREAEGPGVVHIDAQASPEEVERAAWDAVTTQFTATFEGRAG